MFTTITLHNCVTDDPSKPITLDLTPSYPAPAYHPADEAQQVPCSWARQERPTSQGNLEVTLLHRIGEGRIGVIYLARVDKAIRDGIDSTSSLPETLCLKFAKQHHCRSLAREAWFYEQFHRWHGIAVPNYYGFFTSTINTQALTMDTFDPWTNLRTPSKKDPAFKRDRELAKKYRSKDWLWDDVPRMERYFSPSQYKTKTRWYKWNLDKKNPNIGLIIMEILGKSSLEVGLPKESRDSVKSDILAVIDDLAGDGMCHTDIAARNFVQFDGPETDERRCPRHEIVHKWRLIDFDRACMVDITNVGLNADHSFNIDKRRLEQKSFFRRNSSESSDDFESSDDE